MPGHRFDVFSTLRIRRRQRGVEPSNAFVSVGPKTMESDDQVSDGEYPRRFPNPDEDLPFTLGDLRRAIPSHCFKRSALRSFSYLARDVIAIAALVYASTFIDTLPVAMAMKYGILWPAYWFWVSAFGVGIWIVSHECGHGAFSERQWLNDLVGFCGHSFLLIPYFSW